MSISTFFGLLCSIILAAWAVPTGLKWFAFMIYRAYVPYGPLAMSWANEICSGDAEERTIVLGVMNSVAYAFNAWVPLLTYPQVDSPKFRKGFIFSTLAFTAQFGITWLVWWMQRRDKRKVARASG
jgi:ACS family pantothenate transporter-like MFS transporter